MNWHDLIGLFDHSLLQQTLTDEQLRQGCLWARSTGTASVCIKPYAVSMARDILADVQVKVCTVIGFPHGGHRTTIKVAEAEQALADGATELDMVVNIGKVLSRDWDDVSADIAAVVEVAHSQGGLVKVIFENCFLDDFHKIKLCEICAEVGADFVKTSTGYGETGATDHDLALMRRNSPPSVQVKAAGGVRNYARVLEVCALGVTRIGTTSTAAILEDARLSGVH